MKTIFEKIGSFGIVPVVIVDDEANAEPLANALVDAKLPCAEITFRTDMAGNVIKRMRKSQPSMLIGAGTIVSKEQVNVAIDAGAEFIVSPGLNLTVVEYCLGKDIPVIPGVVTPTEICTAIEVGLDVVKYFPAEASGGLPYLNAISAPFKKMKFIPTGGIDEKNLLSYLRLPNVLACGGSWMVKPDFLARRGFEEIKKLTSEAVSTMLGFQLRHVGINNGDAKTAELLANKISSIFNWNQRDTEGSVFVGANFEVLKRPNRGTHGHCAIQTNFIERAIAYFERNGIHTIPETLNSKDGKLHTVYLDMDLGGFAVHLIQL